MNPGCRRPVAGHVQFAGGEQCALGLSNLDQAVDLRVRDPRKAHAHQLADGAAGAVAADEVARGDRVLPVGSVDLRHHHVVLRANRGEGVTAAHAATEFSNVLFEQRFGACLAHHKAFEW